MITKRVMQPILLALTLLLGITVGWAFAISVLGAGMSFLLLIETTQVNPSKVARIFSLLLLTLGFLLLAGTAEERENTSLLLLALPLLLALQ